MRKLLGRITANPEIFGGKRDGQIPVAVRIRFPRLAQREVDDAVNLYKQQAEDLGRDSSTSWIA